MPKKSHATCFRDICYLRVSPDQAMYRQNFPWKCNVLLKINDGLLLLKINESQGLLSDFP